MILFLDCETYSEIPLNRGTARYATKAEVMIVTWAVDDGPVRIWDATVGAPMPFELIRATEACTRVVVHNANFDRTIFRHAMPSTARMLEGKWYCTMAAAYRHGLPGGLEKLCEVFRVEDESKKHKGRDLIHFFCKPNKIGLRNTRITHPQEWRAFCEYAKSDISSMRAVYRKLPKWNDTERELGIWRLDQEINDRGIAVDVDFARAALRATTAEQKRLAKRTQELTDDAVLRTTQRDQLLRFLFVEHGVQLPDLKADTVERRLNDPELPEYVKEVLRIRQQASKSSTTKYKRLLDMEVGGRLYLLLQYGGAYRTLRWAGRDFQPQNLPRPKLKFPAILEAIQQVIDGVEEVFCDDIMEAMSSALRSVLVAGPGKKLVAADLANIEGRKLAWLAGEEWKLEAFRAFDAGIGPDLYKVAYARSFGVDPDDVPDDGDERQIGKVQELALGYEGGVGAFVSMASVYNMDLEEMARKAKRNIPKATWLDATSTWQWAKRKNRTLGLSENVYLACESLKRLWRDAHPATTAFWHDLNVACCAAIQSPEQKFHAGRIVVDRKGAWLRLQLPSGRYLLYPAPRVVDGRVEYRAWNVYTKTFRHEGTYGGKLAENVTQASARDVMADGMLRASANEYPIVLTVHDEVVAETPDDPAFSAEGLSAMLATVPEWARGLPLAAKGFESKRYRKG